jgi:3-methyladenine DNA glycosylase/8-oxoguanine DNA glycosylase
LNTDPIMSGLMEKLGPIRFRARRHSLFQALTRAIVYQQLSGKAAATIFARFMALYPDVSFPAPAQVAQTSLDRLRGAGLSRPKAAYIVDLAERCHAGWLPSMEECGRLTDGEIIARLTEVKGIGRWTVEMLLIFNLGRPDVLPVGDLGIRRGYQIAYRKRKMPEPEHLADFGSRWAPHRTTAARYLWRAADGTKKT